MATKITRTASNKLLLRLSAFLYRLPKGRFYYGTWVGGDWKGAPDLSCGTTACALGWAATLPEFNAVGLVLLKNAGIRNVNEPAPALFAPERAARDVLGLGVRETRFLFFPEYRWQGETSPSREASPREVARHIRRFVMRRGDDAPRKTLKAGHGG